eukprot:179797-Prorocentrum_minimum.AAC.5
MAEGGRDFKTLDGAPYFVRMISRLISFLSSSPCERCMGLRMIEVHMMRFESREPDCRRVRGQGAHVSYSRCRWMHVAN